MAQLLVTMGDLRPSGIGGIECAFAHDRQCVRQIVEQGFGGVFCAAFFFKKQRQVIFNACRCQPGFQVVHQRAAAGVDVEAFAQRSQRTLHMRIVHRHFAAGQ